MQTKKVAICLSGLFKDIDAHISSLNKYLFHNNVEYDIFICTWTSKDDKKILSTYKPKKYIIQPQIDFKSSKLIEEKNYGMYIIQKVLSMFYNIEQCNKLKSDYEEENSFKYDCTIRYRGDAELLESLDLFSFEMTNLYIPMYGDYYGINDQFAFSNSENMNKYCSTFSNIENYLAAGTIFCPEILNKTTIEINKLELTRPFISYGLRRSDDLLYSMPHEPAWNIAGPKSHYVIAGIINSPK